MSFWTKILSMVSHAVKHIDRNMDGYIDKYEDVVSKVERIKDIQSKN